MDRRWRNDAYALEFRDPGARELSSNALARAVGAKSAAAVAVMHVCGSHEQAIARFGLRATLPAASNVIMGPGCPVCITDMPEIDEAVALARQGVRIATYGDMVRVPGTAGSLADARAAGARIDVVYSVAQAVDLARATRRRGRVLRDRASRRPPSRPPPSLLGRRAAELLRALGAQVHSAGDGNRRGDAGHARRRISGRRSRRDDHRLRGSSNAFVARHGMPGRGGRLRAARHPRGAGPARRDGRAIAKPVVVNMFPRCVTRDGNRNAQKQLWRVFRPIGGRWRGIAHVPNGNLRLRDEWARSTRGGASRSTPRRCGSARRRRWSGSASAETSWPALRRRPTARCSATRACPTRRSAPAWSAARARAASGTNTAA